MPDEDLGRWRERIRERAERESRELPLEVLDELAFHLAEEEASVLADGLSADAARQRGLAALDAASFGELSSRRRTRHAALPSHVAGFGRDIRLALRNLRRSPGFTATALITLAIGIGANTAIFSLVHAVLLRSLPVAHADRLYKLGDAYNCCTFDTLEGNWSVFAYPFYVEVRDRASTFEEVAAMETLRPVLSVRRQTGTGAAESFSGEFVSGNYFTTLGVRTAAGRLFDAEDDRRGAAPVAVASYAAWQKAGLDASAIGAPLTINGLTVTLVGVAAPGFFGDRLDTNPPDFWLPMSAEPAFMRESSLIESPSAGWLYIVGRLKPNASPTVVQAQLTTMLRNYLRVPGHVNHPDDVQKIDAQTIRLAPGGGGNNAMQRVYQQGLYLLLAVSAAVLLIACANLANLLLVRGAARRTSIAIEIAMGASRSQILRRQLIESLVLSLAGGAAGLLTAIVMGRAILAVAFRGTPQVPIAVSPSLPILTFAFAVSVVTGVLFGAGPAWLVSRGDPADTLRGSVRMLGGEAVSQRLLVMSQAAMSLVPVTVAALLSQSLRNLDRQPVGFETDGRLVVGIDPQSAGYTQPQLAALYRRLDDRLSRVAGVTSESLALYTPQDGNFLWGARIYLENAKGPFPATWDRIGPRYFETIGTPLVRGRTIDEHDTADAPRVAVVNETFAARYFPNGNPIGHHFGKYTAGHANDFEIIGVVKDAKYVDLSQPVRPMFFVPVDQAVAYDGEIPNKIEESSRYVSSIAFAVRGDPDGMQPLIRGALADVDPNLAPRAMMSLRELVGIATSQRTLTARLSDAFGLVALLLAAIGLYGVTAYRVTRRRHEIGLRMALGATRRDIAAMVVGGACWQACVGLIAGIPLAVLAARALQSQLFGVSPFSAPVLLLSSALVGACAVVASAVPARRASALAPMDALRRD